MFGQIKTFFYRTSNYFVVALVLSIALVAIEYGPVLYKSLSDFDGGHSYGFESTSQYADRFIDSLNSIPLAATLITALVWGLVGLAAYTIFYLLANIWIDTHNEMYRAAESSIQGARPLDILQQAGGKLIAAIGYLFFVCLSLIYLIKMWMNMVYVYVYSGLENANLPLFLLGLAGLTINIYLIIVLAYLIWKNNEVV